MSNGTKVPDREATWRFLDERLATFVSAAKAEAEEVQAQRSAEEAEAELRRAEASEVRQKFIDATRPEPTSAKLYAEWLVLWILQGGTVRYFPAYGVPSSLMTPTVGGPSVSIPRLYGANALQLLVDERRAAISRAATNDDDRPGWEWGHTQVLRITVTDGGLEAWTNAPDRVYGYPDALRLIADTELRALPLVKKELNM